MVQQSISLLLLPVCVGFVWHIMRCLLFPFIYWCRPLLSFYRYNTRGRSTHIRTIFGSGGPILAANNIWSARTNFYPGPNFSWQYTTFPHPSNFSLSALCSFHPLSLPPTSHPSHFFSSLLPLFLSSSLAAMDSNLFYVPSSFIFLFAFSSKLHMLFPVTLWYTYTCHATHLPIPLQLSRRRRQRRSFLQATTVQYRTPETVLASKFVAKFNCLPFMLLCTCNTYSFKVFDALAHLSAGDKFVWCVTKGAGLLNHVTTRICWARLA